MNQEIFKALLALIVLAGLIFIGVGLDYRETQAHAQEPLTEVAPYRFADTPDGTHLYKAVHEGCELFIAQKTETNYNAHSSDTTGVAIATGRGCK